MRGRYDVRQAGAYGKHPEVPDGLEQNQPLVQIARRQPGSKARKRIALPVVREQVPDLIDDVRDLVGPMRNERDPAVLAPHGGT